MLPYEPLKRNTTELIQLVFIQSRLSFLPLKLFQWSIFSWFIKIVLPPALLLLCFHSDSVVLLFLTLFFLPTPNMKNSVAIIRVDYLVLWEWFKSTDMGWQSFRQPDDYQQKFSQEEIQYFWINIGISNWTVSVVFSKWGISLSAAMSSIDSWVRAHLAFKVMCFICCSKKSN